MTEIKLKTGSFWLLRNDADRKNKEVVLFDDLNDAIKAVKARIDKNVEPDNISLLMIDASEDEMVAKGVSWSEIAKALVKLK